MTEIEKRTLNLLSKLLKEIISIKKRLDTLEEKVNVIVNENVLKVKNEVNLESMDR